MAPKLLKNIYTYMHVWHSSRARWVWIKWFCILSTWFCKVCWGHFRPLSTELSSQSCTLSWENHLHESEEPSKNAFIPSYHSKHQNHSSIQLSLEAMNCLHHWNEWRLAQETSSKCNQVNSIPIDTVFGFPQVNQYLSLSGH